MCNVVQYSILDVRNRYLVKTILKINDAFKNNLVSLLYYEGKEKNKFTMLIFYCNLYLVKLHFKYL